MSSRISSTRQAVMRGPNFTGLGKRPVLTPSHHVDRETGIGPAGARMLERRRKPVSGSWCDMIRLRLLKDDDELLQLVRTAVELGFGKPKSVMKRQVRFWRA